MHILKRATRLGGPFLIDYTLRGDDATLRKVAHR